MVKLLELNKKLTLKSSTKEFGMTLKQIWTLFSKDNQTTNNHYALWSFDIEDKENRLLNLVLQK